MDQTFYIKKDDTRPVIKAIARDSEGQPRDLSNVTEVEFYMADAETEDVLINSVGRVADASEGRIEYEWSSGDTSDVGDYIAEFRLTYDDGGVERFPNYGTIDVKITEGLV